VTIAAICTSLPVWAADVGRTFATLAVDAALTPTQSWGCLLACAYAARSSGLIRAVEAETPLAVPAVQTAKAIAVEMTMNATYFKAVQLLNEPDVSGLRAGLHKLPKSAPGIGPHDLALWRFAVAGLLGCGPCLHAHAATLRDHGAAPAQMQAALKIAAAAAAAAAAFQAEATITPA
jgi:lipoyl-dependent peroxiredoxin subunit D